MKPFCVTLRTKICKLRINENEFKLYLICKLIKFAFNSSKKLHNHHRVFTLQLFSGKGVDPTCSKLR